MKLLVDSNEISDLNKLVTALKNSPKCTQLFVYTRLPLSILTIQNPFNTSIKIIDENGTIIASGDQKSFIAISIQHIYLDSKSIPIYIIPADKENPQKPLNYSIPR